MFDSLKQKLKGINFLRTAKDRWQNFWIDFSMKHFNNPLGIRLNAFYAFHHWYCRLRSGLKGKKLGQPTKSGDILLAKNGFAIFAASGGRASLIKEVGEKMSRLYADKTTHNKRVADPSFVQIAEVLDRVPQIINLLDEEIEKIAEQYFQSNFKIFRVSMYRTLPKPESYEQLKNAWRWHSDSYPNQVIKVMFYLTDTDRRAGAFRVHPRSSSRDLVKQGFADRYQADRFLTQLEDPNRYVWAEGPAGTVVFFDDNLVHRATPPEYPNHRDVVVFEIMPHSKPWRDHFREVGTTPSSLARHSMKWHTNPFSK